MRTCSKSYKLRIFQGIFGTVTSREWSTILKLAIGVAGIPTYQITANERGKQLQYLHASMQLAHILHCWLCSKLHGCIGAPADSIVRVSDSGWITATLFAEWAESFVKTLPKDVPWPYLLLLATAATSSTFPSLNWWRKTTSIPLPFQPTAHIGCSRQTNRCLKV